MTEIGSFEAKTHFSELLRRVEGQGEKFIVTMRGRPVALLGPLEPVKATGETLTALLDELRAFRDLQAGCPPLLKPGETWKEFARDGLA